MSDKDKDKDKKADFRSKKDSGRTSRDKNVYVKSAKGRTNSSTRWLARQLNDPYVKEAQRMGLRSRAAFKIIEIDEKIKLFKKGQVVVDLGAAPGGWSQHAAKQGAGTVIAIDILPMDEMPGVINMEMDFTADDAEERMFEVLDGRRADVVMSDMAPNTVGHKNTDHIRIMMLVELGYDFAIKVLKPGGTFVSKVRQGGAQGELLNMMKRDFKSIKHMKPPSSRKGSAEQFVVALDFKGNQDEN